MLIFNEEKHTYSSVHNEDKFISCSTIVGLFHKHFDRRFWGLYIALKNVEGDDFKGWKYMKVKDEQYLLNILSDDLCRLALEERSRVWEQWDEKNLQSRIKGTNFHNSKENEALKTGVNTFKDYPWKTIDFKSKYLTMSIEELRGVNYYNDLEDGYYPELLLFSHELGLAGTSDSVYIKTIEGVRYCMISDLKTNSEIKTENKYDNMLFPLGSLADVNANHYRIQISLYGYLLELMGFKVLYTEFTHNKDDGSEVVYEIDYYNTRGLVISMIEVYLENLSTCKKSFNSLLNTDYSLQSIVEDLINNEEHIENGLELYKFDDNDFRDNLIRYLCKSLIQENRN